MTAFMTPSHPLPAFSAFPVLFFVFFSTFPPQQILNDAEAIRAEYKEQPQHLDHLCSLIKDLYQVRKCVCERPGKMRGQACFLITPDA